jgi:hypothetical protein
MPGQYLEVCHSGFLHIPEHQPMKAYWEIHTIFWLENLNGRHHSEDKTVDGKIILKWILET